MHALAITLTFLAFYLPLPRKTSLAFYAVFVQNLSVFVCVCVSVLLILVSGVVSHLVFKFISFLHELCVCVHLCIHQNVLRVCYISSSKFIHFILSLSKKACIFISKTTTTTRTRIHPQSLCTIRTRLRTYTHVALLFPHHTRNPNTQLHELFTKFPCYSCSWFCRNSNFIWIKHTENYEQYVSLKVKIRVPQNRIELCVFFRWSLYNKTELNWTVDDDAAIADWLYCVDFVWKIE